MKDNNHYALTSAVSAVLGWFFAMIIFAPLAIYFGIKGTKAEQGYNVLAWLGIIGGIFEASLLFIYILTFIV